MHDAVRVKYNDYVLSQFVSRTEVRFKKSDEELFWKRVVKPSENVCWTFSGVPSIRRYTRLFLNGKRHYPHKDSYERMNE